jgi:hypothetical protein
MNNFTNIINIDDINIDDINIDDINIDDININDMNIDSELTVMYKPETLRRSYTISFDSDYQNISNGLCPNYALEWGIKPNLAYWPHGYDFIIGQRQFDNKDTKFVSKINKICNIMSTKLQNYYLSFSQENLSLFCNLDGVLADFNTAFEKISRQSYVSDTKQNDKKWIQKIINKNLNFFEKLPFMYNAEKLWKHIIKYKPIILINDPNSVSAKLDRINWCKKKLGSNFLIINNISEIKTNLNYDYYVIITNFINTYSFKNAILIGNQLSNEDWESSGGLFINHSPENLSETLNIINMIME